MFEKLDSVESLLVYRLGLAVEAEIELLKTHIYFRLVVAICYFPLFLTLGCSIRSARPHEYNR